MIYNDLIFILKMNISNLLLLSYSLSFKILFLSLLRSKPAPAGQPRHAAQQAVPPVGVFAKTTSQTAPENPHRSPQSFAEAYRRSSATRNEQRKRGSGSEPMLK